MRPSVANRRPHVALNRLSATEIVRAVAAGETTCEAVVRDCIARIDARETWSKPG